MEKADIYKNFKSSILHPVTLLSGILFLLHQIFQHVLKIPIVFLDSYLDMALFAIILLSLRLFEKRLIFGGSIAEIISLQEVVIISIFVPLVTEIIFPRFDSIFIADIFDFVSFFIGAFIFYFFINKPFHLNDYLDAHN